MLLASFQLPFQPSNQVYCLKVERGLLKSTVLWLGAEGATFVLKRFRLGSCDHHALLPQRSGELLIWQRRRVSCLSSECLLLFVSGCDR